MACNIHTEAHFHPTGLTADDVDVTVADVGDTHLIHIFIKTDRTTLYLALDAMDAEVVQRALSDGLMEARIRRARADGECICDGGDLPAFDHDATCPRSEEVGA